MIRKADGMSKNIYFCLSIFLLIFFLVAFVLALSLWQCGQCWILGQAHVEEAIV